MPTTDIFAARILAVEEDPLWVTQLQSGLQQQGHRVTLRGAADGLALAEVDNFDLILLTLLGPDGLDRLQQLRQRSRVPVVLMSGLGDEQHRIAGFRLGADDYLPKPFTITELCVRVAAILRRVAFERQAMAPPQPAGELVFDEPSNDVLLDGHPAGLTLSEYRVLTLLHRQANQVVTKPDLYQQALRRGYARHDRSLDMHVSHLRRKLQAIGYRAGRLDTVWGQGYMLVTDTCAGPPAESV